MRKEVSITFFTPGNEMEANEGKLIFQNDKIIVGFESKAIGSFTPLNTLYAFAKLTGEKYTLVNCVLNEVNVFTRTYIVNEIYEGAHLEKVIEKNCMQAEARITGLTKWLNDSRIQFDSTHITTEDESVKVFKIGDGITLQLHSFLHIFTSWKKIVLSNKSCVRVIAAKPISRLEMQDHCESFLKLLSIFTDKMPQFSKLDFTFEGGTEVSSMHYDVPDENDDNDSSVTLNMIDNEFPKTLEIFHKDRDKFVQVLDLVNASIQNRTPEVSFLNITTAFEVYHSKFLENSSTNELRRTFAKEVIDMGLPRPNDKKWDLLLRCYHLFKLVEGIEFFKTYFKDKKLALELIKDSRNYYTHYTPTKKEIWSPNELILYNRLLVPLMKGVILRHLQVPDKLINKILNYRLAILYHSYEKNEYSMHYVPDEGNKFE